MHGRYVADILKMCMKKFNAEKIFFEKFTGFRPAHCGGYTVSIAFSQFLVLVVATWMTIIVTLSGDVELNPGPDSVESDTDSSYNTSFEGLANHLSILHFNVQSLLPKLDLIAAESEAYAVLVFSEAG